MFTRLNSGARAQKGVELQEQAVLLSQIAAGRQRHAANIAIQGANLQAASYRSAAQSRLQISNYNRQLDSLDTKKKIQSLTTNTQNLLSSQRAAAASTGFATSSQSFTAIAHETLSSAESQIIDMRNSSAQRQKVASFEAQVDVTALENQARAAEFAGAVQAWKLNIDAELTTLQSQTQRLSR